VSNQEAQPAYVVALDGDVQPQQFSLEVSSCTIGRASICQIVIARNVVSRLHARIEQDGPRYVLADAGSANGTFVNGQPIAEPHILKDRDVLGFGAAGGLLRFADPETTYMPIRRLEFDTRMLTFRVGETRQPLKLTPTEFHLLRHLYEHVGAVCTRESCAQAIWGEDFRPGADADTLDRAISSIRVKIRQLDPAADLIETRRGLGYMLNL
jgi:DNA-binding response OmpR family regulator